MLDFRPVSQGAGLPTEEDAGEFFGEIASIAEIEQSPPWCAYLGWEQGRAMVFGAFKTPPDPEGEVEIGYLTFARHEGKGLAKQAAAYLIEVARTHGASRVSAHTLPEQNASTGVLVANGFARDGWGEDEDVGRVWRWQLVL